MHKQFLELADVDITKEAMEVGPTCHYMMGGVRVDADTQASTVPGLFAAGEVAAGLHGANRLGGNSLSDLLVFGQRAGLFAAQYAGGLTARPTASGADLEQLSSDALRPFDAAGNENPYAIQQDLQQSMQALVGIIRTEDELTKALEELAVLRDRATRVRVEGHRQYNPGWHLALDLGPLLAVSECVTRAALERTESRGAQTREDYPTTDPELGRVNVVVREHDGDALAHARTASADAGRASRAAGGRLMANVTVRIWRGDADGGDFRDYEALADEGEVVLDVLHRIQASQAGDLALRWNCKAGRCGSCSTEINGLPRLACMTRVSELPADQPITVAPLRAFPIVRDLVTDVSFNYEKAKQVPPFRPRPKDADGRYRMQQADIDRVQEFHRCIECFLCQDVCHVIRDHEENKPAFAGPRMFVRYAELEMHPLDTNDRRELLQARTGLGMCNITKCCTEVCPEHIRITDNAIIPLKERVVDARYDPVAWLVRKITRR